MLKHRSRCPAPFPPRLPGGGGSCGLQLVMEVTASLPRAQLTEGVICFPANMN